MSKSKEELSGRFDRVRWKSDDGSFFIGTLEDGTSVKGNCIGDEFPTHRMTYLFYGHWVDHPRYGKSFMFESYVMEKPKDKHSIIIYLTKYLKGMGVGPVRAGQLVDKFGEEDVLRILKDSPSVAAKSIQRLSEENCRLISAKLKELEKYESTILKLTALFSGRGFHGGAIDKAISMWDVKAPDVIQRDPYKLLIHKFPGAGFDRVDTLFLSLGHSPDKLKRQVLCLWNYMRTDMSGSVWFPAISMQSYLREKVSSRKLNFVRAIKVGVKSGWIVGKKVDGQLYLSTKDASRDEKIVTDCVFEMISGVSINELVRGVLSKGEPEGVVKQSADGAGEVD